MGYATLHTVGVIDLRKDVGNAEAVASRRRFNEMIGTRGIVQLRSATFGAPSKANFQLHLDSNGSMVGAYNGNIANNVELRKQFIVYGMIVHFPNDSETCVHTVERHLRCRHDSINAIRQSYVDLKGD